MLATSMPALAVAPALMESEVALAVIVTLKVTVYVPSPMLGTRKLNEFADIVLSSKLMVSVSVQVRTSVGFVTEVTVQLPRLAVKVCVRSAKVTVLGYTGHPVLGQFPPVTMGVTTMLPVAVDVFVLPPPLFEVSV